MKTELTDQSVAELRRVLSRMESSAPLAPNLEIMTAPVAAPPRKRVSGVVVAGMTALAIVAVVISALLFPGQQPEQTPTVSPPSTDSPITPSTIAQPGVSVEWTYVEVPAYVDALGFHQDRFIAVAGGRALFSVDGTEWTELGELTAEGRAWVHRLVSDGQHLVAGGDLITPEPDGASAAHPAVWASSDAGVTWTQTKFDGFVVDIASTPSGFVAAGFVNLGQEGDHVLRQATVWVSGDGMTWTLAWSSDDPDGLSSRADAVVWDGAGLTVRGWHGPHPYHEGAGMFTGPVWDRVSWTGPSPSELGNPTAIDLPGSIEDHTRTPGGHIALVYGVDRSVKDSSAVWGSDNGVDWTPIEVDPGSWSYEGVAADGQTIVIVGHTLGASDNPETKVWLSTDGATWESVDVSALPEKLRLASVVLQDGVLVVAGHLNSATPYYLITGRFSP